MSACDEPYFLCPSNPVANSDQRSLEDMAIAVFERPEVREARRRALGLWLAVTDHDAPQEARVLAAEAIDEYCFNYTLKAAASDAQHPRVLRLFLQPHAWFGRTVPGARLGGDNPDNCYRLIAIEHGARYEIEGRPCGTPASDVTWTLVANNATSRTLASLEQHDVECTGDGSFVLTISPEPAAARRNHVQTAPGVKWLFVRDSMGDWARQTPLALRVRRITPPVAGPIGAQEVARRAVEMMIEDVPITFWFTRLNFALPPNVFSRPQSSGRVGGLVSQWTSCGRIALRDDEALVVRANGAQASYRHFIVNDWWYRSIDPWHRQSSLNNASLLPDADGRFTCVVALHDPGVHNWIDTGGLHQTYAIQKWQGLPRTPVPDDVPTIEARLVKLAELDAALPAGTARITPAQRATELAARARAYARRIDDH